MAPSYKHIEEELKGLLTDELQVVTYKWLARRFDLPANTAKQLLFTFFEQHRDEVAATYLISGWIKGTEPPRHTVSLVHAAQLAKKRAGMEPITSLHVYSLQPSQPKDPAELWSTDNVQLGELFAALLSNSGDQKSNCLADNRCSAVACVAARHDPALRTRQPPRKPEPNGAPALQSAAKPVVAGGAIDAIGAVMAGKKKPGGPAPEAVAGPAPAAVAGPLPPMAAVADERRPSGLEPASVHHAAKRAGSPAPGPPAKRGSTAAAIGKGAVRGSLSQMWTSAPDKGNRRGRMPLVAAAPGADTMIRADQEESDSEDDVGEDGDPANDGDRDGPSEGEGAEEARAPAPRPSRRRGLILESEDDDDEPAPAPGTAAPHAMGAGRRGQGSGAVGRVAKAATPPAAAAGAGGRQDNMSLDRSEAPAGQMPRQGVAGKVPKPAPRPGTVKASLEPGPPMRQRVARTIVTEDGEEVTEMVWEGAKALAVPAPAPAPAPTPAPASAMGPAPSPAKVQPGPKPGDGGARGSGRGGRRGAGGRGRGATGRANAGQRGIMAFLAKK